MITTDMHNNGCDILNSNKPTDWYYNRLIVLSLLYYILAYKITVLMYIIILTFII